jgi:cysteine synthase A
MKIHKSVTELIGNTPLVELTGFCARNQLTTKILGKLESQNPGGSIKDRIALAMIDDAEQRGLLKPGDTIIEPTSGNTGIGLAMIAAVRGYWLTLTMPEGVSAERIKLTRAYGAKVILTDGTKGMTGAVERAEELHKTTPNSIMLRQFENPANPDAHYDTTAAELWNDTKGKIDIVVAGIGTGGTISGIGEYLKCKSPKIQIIGVEPADSPFLTTGKSGAHKIQGIGAGFAPNTLNRAVVDEILTVSYVDAYTACGTLAVTEGILAGISSGAALAVATQVAKRKGNENKTIVVILPDTGERYLSTDLWEPKSEPTTYPNGTPTMADMPRRR